MMPAETVHAENTIAPEEWLRVIREDYLSDYLTAGGSAVKVISGSPETLEETRAGLRELARNHGFFTGEMDPARVDRDGKKPDLHRIDRFFLAATENADWKGWSAAQARRYFAEQGVRIAPERELSDLEGIAQDNGRDPRDLLSEYQQRIATDQIRDRGMALEFRTAVTALGRAQIVPEANTPATEEVLLAWFRGRAHQRAMPGSPAALRRLGIYEAINHNNARHFLASFCHWLPRAEYSGLLAVLDFRPYEYKRIPKAQRQREELQRLREAVARGASTEEMQEIVAESRIEPEVIYTEAQYMQMLTMIRHFIDEIDSFQHLMLVILTSPAFYDERSGRNYWNYDALQTRIGQEVHDVRRANPTASLVHLATDAERTQQR